METQEQGTAVPSRKYPVVFSVNLDLAVAEAEATKARDSSVFSMMALWSLRYGPCRHMPKLGPIESVQYTESHTPPPPMQWVLYCTVLGCLLFWS
jgi:hypothetical protein